MTMPPSNPIKILVVDDKKVIQDFFEITLGYYGHLITGVQDPRLAAKIANEQSFDIAFIDMVMPEKEGVEVLKSLKEICPALPVVMMSGYSIQEKKDEAIRLGAMGCLKKPFELEDVRKVVKQVIDRDI